MARVTRAGQVTIAQQVAFVRGSTGAAGMLDQNLTSRAFGYYEHNRAANGTSAQAHRFASSGMDVRPPGHCRPVSAGVTRHPLPAHWPGNPLASIRMGAQLDGEAAPAISACIYEGRALAIAAGDFPSSANARARAGGPGTSAVAEGKAAANRFAPRIDLRPGHRRTLGVCAWQPVPGQACKYLQGSCGEAGERRLQGRAPPQVGHPRPPL